MFCKVVFHPGPLLENIRPVVDRDKPVNLGFLFLNAIAFLQVIMSVSPYVHLILTLSKYKKGRLCYFMVEYKLVKLSKSSSEESSRLSLVEVSRLKSILGGVVKIFLGGVVKIFLGGVVKIFLGGVIKIIRCFIKFQHL